MFIFNKYEPPCRLQNPVDHKVVVLRDVVVDKAARVLNNMGYIIDTDKICRFNEAGRYW